MSSIISITGRLDEKTTVAYVKNSLKQLQHGSEVIFEIDSAGGNLEALRKIKGFMYFLHTKKNITVTGHLIYAASAALLLFLNCEHRVVTDSSIGIIHLPVLNKKWSLEKWALKREEEISFIVRRSGKITSDEVIKLENKELRGDELIAFGIATKKVDSFAET